MNNSCDASLNKGTITQSITRDENISSGYTGVLYSSTPMVASNVSNSDQSPHTISSASYKVPATVIASQSVSTSSLTFGKNVTVPGLSSLNLGLPQEDDNNSLFSDGRDLLSATTFPVSTIYSATNTGINLSSCNDESYFSVLGMNFASSTAMTFPSSCSSSPSTSSILSFGFLGNYTMASTAPMFSSNIPAGVESKSTSSNVSSLFREASSSFNLRSNFSLNASRPATSVGCSSRATLFATSSGLNLQINPSALQSIPLSTASSVGSTSTIDSKNFPSLVNATTAAALTPLFTTTSLSLGTSSQLSSDGRGKQDEGDEVEVLNESQPIDDGYTPLVKLADTNEVKLGEEDKTELFSNRGKLYRFDQSTKAWKERGTGAIKIIQHKVTGKVRVLMRNFLKIYCNHYITGEMELAPLASSNTSWAWITLSDFSDEEAKVEILCIRFKLFEVAQYFKAIFTDYVQKVKIGKQKGSDSGSFKLDGTSLSVVNQPASVLSAVTIHSSTSADVIVQCSGECVVTGELRPSEKEIELARHYKLPPMFYNYQTKPPYPGCIGCEDDSDVPTMSNADTVPSVVTSASTTGSMLFGTSGGKLPSFGMPSGLTSALTTTAPLLFGASDSGLQSFASLANATEFQFGRETSKKGFAGAGTMLFQSQKEASEDHADPETELDVDFKPLVNLPDTYQVITGQESEEQLFCERAKLYRYDPNSKQWKERGIGNMTIMKNRESGKSRLVMRREQVLKLCCNHVILPTMQLNPMVGGGNACRWFTPCDFSEEESKPEQLAIRFKRKEQADSFQEVFLRCIQEGAKGTTNKVNFSSAHTEEQQFSADIKFYQFQVNNKLWERKGVGKVSIIRRSKGSQIMRVVNANNYVFYEQSLSSTCKLAQLPSEAKSWTWCYTRKSTTEVTRYAMIFIELFDSNQFKQVVHDFIVTLVSPHTPRSPEIPPLSPASSDGGSTCQGRGRPLIKAIKSVGIWSCDNCNNKNPGSESECLVCSAKKSKSPLLSPTGRQCNNSFFSKGKPIDYNVSSLTSSILSLTNSATGSDGRSYTPFSNIGLLHHQQGGSESDGPPSLVSVPSQESTSAVSFEKKHEVTKALFKMPTFTISETKTSFPLLNVARSDNFSSVNSAQPDKEEEHPETEANIFFDPVVSLPSDFDNKSGEENEECVFTHRAKLYRFNNKVKMWKERGIGNIKILKHKTSNKGRILMRREQVLKLCCNHYIVSGMTLKPGSFPDRSWMWFTSADYSEEVAQPEMLCVKFKDAEIASTFEKIFYTFATNAESLTVKPADLIPEPSEDDVVYIGEELPEQEFINLAQQYMLPRTFYNYLKKDSCPGCRGCIDEEMECEVVPSNANILPTVTIPEVKQNNVLLFSSGSETVSFADLASAAKGTGGFGSVGLGSSDNKGFAGAGKPLFSSQTGKENDSLDSFESTAEFKPIVKLSSDVKLQSGEEDEIVLFSHRAKLYRFDAYVKQWKERGTGNIKILKHKKTGKCRILMRREQILKLCCNHWIAKGMTLTVWDEKVLQWMTLNDFSDEEPKAEQFSVRFKLADTAKSFQQIFNDCLSNVDSAEGTSLQSFTSENTFQVTNSSCNPPNTVNNCVTLSCDSTTTSMVSTVKEHTGVTSCSAAMEAALILPSVTTGSASLATQPTVSSIFTSSYDATTLFTVNTVKEQSGVTTSSISAMTTALIFPSVTTSSAIQSTFNNSVIASTSTFTVNSVKEQPSVTSSTAVTTALTFPPATTGTTTLFVFGSSGDKPSKLVSSTKFSFTPKTDAFKFSMKRASNDPNIFGSSNSGAFNFTMKSATSIPSVFDNQVVSFLQPTEKEPDDEADSQNEEWVTKSVSECWGSEHNLEQSEDYEDEDNSISSVNNTLADDIDSSITSVGTLVDQQEGVALITKDHSQVHDDSSGDSGEAQQQ